MTRAFNSPAREIRSEFAPKAPTRHDAAVPTRAEVAELLRAAADQPRDALAMRVLYVTGMRRNEVLELTFAALDYRERRVFISAGKGDKDRYVLMDPRTAELLQQRQQGQSPGISVFGLSSPSSLSNLIRRYATKSGIYQKYEALGLTLSVHSLRHAFATHAYENGLDIYTLRRLLGHQYLDTTALYIATAARDWRMEYERFHPFSEHKALSFSQEYATELAPEVAGTAGKLLPLVPGRAEVAALLQAAHGQPGHYATLRLLYATGLHVSELPRAQVDLHTGTVEVPGRPCPVFIDPETRRVLRDSPASLADAAVIVSTYADLTGLTARYVGMGRTFTEDCLRHAFASHCYENGMELFTLHRLLGNANLGVTEMYHATAVARRLPAYLASHEFTRPPQAG